MRISAIAALCTAPLALAGTLDMELRNRASLSERDGLSEIIGDLSGSSSKGKDSEKSSSYSSGSSGSSSNDNSQITTIEQVESSEVILIWLNAGADATTTTVNSAAATAASSAAATHTVTVGGSEKVFTPDTIEANVGDLVLFQFAQENHTATTSAFTTPCTANGAFDTGFMPNLNGTTNPPPQAMMLVNVSTPIWFYCRQKTPASHCGLGMTFSINPTANKTQADFKAAAILQDGSGSTSGIISSSGSSSVVSVASSATSVAAAPPAVSSSSSSSGLTTGQGTTDSTGSCTCAVVCAEGSIPNPAAQGANSFGGMGSSIPAANLAT